VVIMYSKSKPSFHIRSVLLIFVTAIAVLSVKIGKNALQEEEKTSRICQLFLCVFAIYPFFLNKLKLTYASVGLITNMCRLHESLLTANQFPSLLKAIE